MIGPVECFGGLLFIDRSGALTLALSQGGEGIRGNELGWSSRCCNNHGWAGLRPQLHELSRDH